MSDIKKECYSKLQQAMASNNSDEFIKICKDNKYKDCITEVVNEKRGINDDTILHIIANSFDLNADAYKILVKVGADITAKNNKNEKVVDILKRKQMSLGERKDGEELTFNSENEKRIYNDIERKINIIEGRELNIDSEMEEKNYDNIQKEANNIMEQQEVNEEKSDTIKKEEIDIVPIQDNKNDEKKKNNAEILQKINKTYEILLSEIKNTELNAYSVISEELKSIDEKDTELQKEFVTGVLTKKDNYESTLIELASMGNYNAFRELFYVALEKAPDVVATKYFNGNTILHFACSFNTTDNIYRPLIGQSKIVEDILDENLINIETTNNDNETPLFAACKSGNNKMVELLIQRGANISAINNNNETPLFTACRYGNLETMKLLVNNGADIFTVNKDGKNLFECICSDNSVGDRSKIEQFLNAEVEKKKKVLYEEINDLIKGGNGYNKIKDIIENIKNEEYVQDILQREDTRSGETLLFEACRKGDIDTVKLLVERGANVFKMNRTNKGILDITTNNEVKKYIQNIKAKQYYDRIHKYGIVNTGIAPVQFIFENDKDKQSINLALQLTNDNGETLLFEACRKGDIALVDSLMQYGAGVNVKNKDGKTVIDILNEKEKGGQNNEVKIIKSIINGYVGNNKQNKTTTIDNALQNTEQMQEKIDILHNEISTYIRNNDETGFIRALNNSENKPYIKQVLNIKNSNGNNIFSLACEAKFSNETLYLLTQNGADIFAKNYLNKDILDSKNVIEETRKYVSELRIHKIESQARDYIVNKDYYSLSLLVKYNEKLLTTDIKNELLENTNENDKDIISNILFKTSLINNQEINESNAYNKALECIVNKDYYMLSSILNDYRKNIIEKRSINNEPSGDNLMDVAVLFNDDVVVQILKSTEIYKNFTDLQILDENSRVNNYNNIIKLCIKHSKTEELAQIFTNEERKTLLTEALTRTDGAGETLLFEACEGNNIEIVKLLVENGANIFIENKAHKGILDVITDENIKKYIEQEQEKIKQYYYYAISNYIQNNDINSIQQICENSENKRYITDVLNLQDENGETLLFQACAQRNIQIIDLLIKNGADESIKNKDDKQIFDYVDISIDEPYNKYMKQLYCESYNNALKEYIKDGTFNEEIVNVLSSGDYKDEILNLQDKNGETLLSEACRSGNIEVVKLLVENGANINNDVLDYDIIQNVEIRQYLEEQQTKHSEQTVEANDVVNDINTEQLKQDEQKNEKEQEQVEQEIISNTENKLNQERVVELYNKINELVNKNDFKEINNIIGDTENRKYIKDVLNFTPNKTTDALLNYKDSITGENLLFKMLVYGNDDTFKILADGGVDVFAKNKSGNTILEVLRYEDILENDNIRIKKNKENQNTKNIQIGDYLVRRYIEENKLEELRSVFKKQRGKITDEILNLQDKNGETLLSEACRSGNIEVVKLLVENGANINNDVLDYDIIQNVEIRQYLEEQQTKHSEQTVEANDVVNDINTEQLKQDEQKNEKEQEQVEQEIISNTTNDTQNDEIKQEEVVKNDIQQQTSTKDTQQHNISDNQEQITENEQNKQALPVAESIKNETQLYWSEIGKDIKYGKWGRLDNKSVVTHKDAQQQVYQIAYHYANNPIENIDQNKTYAISDTHGDMGALLESLLRSGTVEFVDPKEPCIVVVDDNNPDNKILIPNLKLKENSNGNKLVVLGDIIDRGYQSDSCMMLMKHLMNQQTEQKSNNIIFTVGNHEDMTINIGNTYQLTIDTNSARDGKNKDYNTARDTFEDMVKQNQMVFCHYDENTNTIYSHVPFDMDNTVNALQFIQNNKDKFNEQMYADADVISNELKQNPNFFENNKDGVKQLVSVFNELYKYTCENKDEKLHQSVYALTTTITGGGLLWNRDYTEDGFKAIPGINCVCGHDPKKDGTQKTQVNKDGNIINIDTIRSCGYLGHGNSINKVCLVEISQGENGKLDHKVLDDVNHIEYSKDLKTIEKINDKEPLTLENNVVFTKKNINSLVARNNKELTKKEKKEQEKQRRAEEKQRKKIEKEEEKRQKQEKKMTRNISGGAAGGHGNNLVSSSRKRRHRFWGFVKKIIDPFNLIFKDKPHNKIQGHSNGSYHGNSYGSYTPYTPSTDVQQNVKKTGLLTKYKQKREKRKENKTIKKEIKKINKELIKEVIKANGNIEEKQIRGQISSIYFNSVNEYANKNYKTTIPQGENDVKISDPLKQRIDAVTKRIDNYFKQYKKMNKQQTLSSDEEMAYGNEINSYIAINKFSKSLGGIETEQKDKKFAREYKTTIKKARKENKVSM